MDCNAKVPSLSVLEVSSSHHFHQMAGGAGCCHAYNWGNFQGARILEMRHNLIVTPLLPRGQQGLCCGVELGGKRGGKVELGNGTVLSTGYYILQ